MGKRKVKVEPVEDAPSPKMSADPYIEYWRALNDDAGPQIVGSPQEKVLTTGWGTDAAAQKICNAHNSAIDRLRAEVAAKDAEIARLTAELNVARFMNTPMDNLPAPE